MKTLRAKIKADKVRAFEKIGEACKLLGWDISLSRSNYIENEYGIGIGIDFDNLEGLTIGTLEYIDLNKKVETQP